ncbi:MAG: adenylate kinase [Actinobacteria bacterium]|nr:MAG: adenylate kinase [Actinomycetota bacterium]
MNVLLLGPQGAGKGTQAKRIAAEYGLPHIATGDILRRAMADGTPLGRKVKPIYDSGGLVPDDLMIELIRARLSEPDTEHGFILDGFPRTFVQAEALDTMLREIDKQLDLVLELQVPDEVAAERLTKRATLEGRPDDTPEAIRRRLELYHEETEPLVEYYRSRGNVVGIHGDRSENEVFAEIQQALEQAGAVA